MAKHFLLARMVSTLVSVSCDSALRCPLRVPHILRSGRLPVLFIRHAAISDLSPPGPGVGWGSHVGLRNLYIYVAGTGSDGPTPFSRRAYSQKSGGITFKVL